jgi:hypothetical protein
MIRNISAKPVACNSLRENGTVPQLARDVGFPAVSRLFERTRYFVTIDGPSVTEEALRIAARHPDVTTLIVGNAPHLDDEAFAALRDSTGVRELTLYKTGVTDKGLRHLRHWNRLLSVSIYECPASDEGIHFLCGLPPMNVITCGRCFTEANVHDLAFASPETATPQIGRPLRIVGRVHVNSRFQSTMANVRIFVENVDAPQPLQGSAAVILNAANKGAFSITARNVGVAMRNSGAELRPGRNVVYVIVELPAELPSKPMIGSRLDRILLDVKPDA